MSFATGDKAPNFSLLDQDGNTHTLADYKGKKLVIFFYPRDNTPGCTKEACSFRDLSSQFKDLNTSILGVSKDSAKSHLKFIDKFSLSFPLLIDEETTMMQAYDCWKEKSFMGKKFMGTVRSTVLIDENSNMIKHWDKVAKAANHPDEVLTYLKSL